MNKHQRYQLNKHMISVWLLKDLYERLYKIAFRNNVSIATYVRGIIIDAIIEEEEKY